MIGGESDSVISDDLITPITLSPDRSDEPEVDGVNVPVPGTPPGEDFWEAWLSEIADSESNDGQGSLAEDDLWMEVYNSSEGQDPRYKLQAYDFGVEYATWMSEGIMRPCARPLTEAKSRAEHDDEHLLQRLHLKQDSDMALVVNAIMSEPAELELPMEIAYMSNFGE